MKFTGLILAQAETGGTGTGGGASPVDGIEQVQELFRSPSLTGWDIALAIAVVLVGWVTSRYAARATQRVLRPVQGLSEDLRRLAARVVRVFIMVLGLGVALGILGAPIRPVLAASILVALVAALSLRGIAENFSAGLVIQGRQPMRVGDQAEILGHQGIVTDVNSRSVVLETFDGRVIHLPNRTVLDEPLVNESASGVRRSELEARWQSSDVDAERELVLETLRAVEGVLEEPPPTVLLVASEATRLTVRAQFWHLPLRGPAVRSAVVGQVASTLAMIDPERAVIAPPPPPPFTPSPPR